MPPSCCCGLLECCPYQKQRADACGHRINEPGMGIGEGPSPRSHRSPPGPDMVMLAQIKATHGRHGGNLHQLVKRLNSYDFRGHPELLALRELAECGQRSGRFAVWETRAGQADAGSSADGSVVQCGRFVVWRRTASGRITCRYDCYVTNAERAGMRAVSRILKRRRVTGFGGLRAEKAGGADHFRRQNIIGRPGACVAALCRAGA